MYGKLRQTIVPLASFFTVALVISLVLINLTTAQFSSANLETVIAEYHASVNQTVNQRIQLAIAQMQKIRQNPELAPAIRSQFVLETLDPETECQAHPTAEKQNLSVTCLYLDLNQQRQKFLNDMRSTTLSGTNLRESAVGVQSLNEQAETLRIYHEELSYNALEVTLDAYTQLLTAFLLHQENELTIAQLDGLKDNLQDLEQIIGTYPSKFHNVTTNVCQ